MSDVTLHYVFDPLCGWCYGAAPLVEAARQVPGLAVAFHGGGMMTGSNRRHISPEWRTYVMPHDLRIADLTGQPFGSAYFDGLLRDTGALLDSEPPLKAILAAEALAGRGLELIHRLQQAHYEEGLRIADTPVLVQLASELGFDASTFEQAFDAISSAQIQAHIAASRMLLQKLRGQGFPTFALEDSKGTLTLLDSGRFLGQLPAWRERLEQAVALG